uniref:Uncharacterized protein n=1 Tax=Globodera rostochiensis TaxID=31243 RepID=A0A914GW37_GLORO
MDGLICAFAQPSAASTQATVGHKQKEHRIKEENDSTDGWRLERLGLSFFGQNVLWKCRHVYDKNLRKHLELRGTEVEYVRMFLNLSIAVLAFDKCAKRTLHKASEHASSVYMQAGKHCAVPQ